MSTKKHIALFIITLLGLAQGIFAQQVQTTPSNSAIQEEILLYINQYRHQHGLTQLMMNDKIVAEAKQHSQDMANHSVPFGHKYFLSRIRRLNSEIKHSNAGAENVAYRYKNAKDVVKNWLLSPGHKRNIDGNYNLTGIGVVRDKEGNLYFTQIFLKTSLEKRQVKTTLPQLLHSLLH